MPEPAVAFLRVVDLGSWDRVPQAPLATRLADALGTPVRHHPDSGSLAVAAVDDPVMLAARTRELVRDDTGLDIPVVVRTARQLSGLVARNPWLDEDPARVRLAMWDDAHDPAREAAMAAADWGGDELLFAGANAWMRHATPFREARLGATAIERGLQVVATARNAQTIRAVLDLARGLGEQAANDGPEFHLPRFRV